MTDKTLVSSMGHILLANDVKNMNYISTILVFKDKLKFEDYKQFLLNKLSNFKEFTCSVHVPFYFGWSRFVEGKFNLENHIKYLKLKEGTKEELEILVSKLASAGLDTNLPLWEAYLIDGYLNSDKKEVSVGLFRFHHYMADSKLTFINTLASNSVQLLLHLFNEKETSKKQILRGEEKKITSKPLKKFIFDSYDTFQNLINQLEDTSTVFKIETPKTDSIKCSLEFNQINMEQLMKVSDSLSYIMTNEILLTSIAGSLNLYAKRYSPPSYVRKFGEDPLVKSSIWVTKRNNPWIYSKPTEKFELLNEMELVLFPIPLETNPSMRSFKLKDYIREIDASSGTLLSKAIFSTLGILPKFLIEKIWKSIMNNVSLSLYNITGPQYPLEMCGVELDDISYFVNPCFNISNMISTFSYNGKISTTVSSVESMKNPNEIIQFLKVEYLNLKGRTPY